MRFSVAYIYIYIYIRNIFFACRVFYWQYSPILGYGFGQHERINEQLAQRI